MSFTKQKAERLYEKLRAREPNTPGVLGVPPNGVGAGVIGSVALGTGAATTTDVTDARIVPGRTACLLEAADLYGSAEKGAGNIWVDFPADGIARIHHTASTKTRTFTYLLMFGLAFLLGTAALGQVIEENGTPLEVAPALNFTTGILCTAGASSSDCEVDTADLSALGIMFDADWATVYGFPYVDWSAYSTCIDANGDGFCEVNSLPGVPLLSFDADSDNIAEFKDVPGVSMFFDVNEDNAAELSFTSTQAAFFGGTTGSFTIDVSPAQDVFVAPLAKLRFGDGIGVGNGADASSSSSLANSSCLGRESATDRLFADRDCDFGTADTRETDAAGIERYTENDNELIRLTADFDNATTTGTEITGLQVSVNGARTYDVTYNLLVQSTSASFATTGVKFGVNYTNGTPAPFICLRTVPTDDVVGAAATGLEEDVHTGGTTGKSFEFWETQTETTTAPDMGPTAGFLTQTATVLETIHCVITTAAGAGDIELWAAASSANNIRVKAQSWANVITVQ